LYAVETAIFEETIVEEGIEQINMGEIDIAERAPCHIRGDNRFLGKREIFKFAAGE
jgi:hypothetical protein